ncbi:hypothetical protein [Denitrobacterium detoxificans]|uniref:hypothetical protein n=1 Tax=Denitrobacterium detoxificans TaxID=79604 RepID=UPI0026F12D72|nr:hypothetical protein [Denitrobacterium detoxificans]MBE6466489.1 hypothetical protein [Denitrobacterium detoxificans]
MRSDANAPTIDGALPQGEVKSVAEITATAARNAGCSEEVIAKTDARLREILVTQKRLDADTPLEDAMTTESFTFAGNVAEQVGGADLSDEHRKAQADADEAMARAARVQDWKAKLSGMSHNERVEATLECFSRRRQFTAVLKDLLEYCREERTLENAEEHIQQHEYYEKNGQSAHRYLFFMQRTGAIEEREYDCDGLPITTAMRQELLDTGATEEELEDLTAEWRYLTTDVGKEALQRDCPSLKFEKLIASKAARRATYNRVIEFCESPRSMDEIFQFLQGDPGLEVNAQGIMGCQPSAYVSHLEDAGVLVWRNGGWNLTRAGVEILKTLAG